MNLWVAGSKGIQPQLHHSYKKLVYSFGITFLLLQFQKEIMTKTVMW